MSRGLGRTQRQVLDILGAEPGRAFPTMLLAAMTFMDDDERSAFQKFDAEIQFLTLGAHPVKPSRRSSVSRACHNLMRSGLIEGLVLKAMPGVSWWRIKPAKRKKVSGARKAKRAAKK